MNLRINASFIVAVLTLSFPFSHALAKDCIGVVTTVSEHAAWVAVEKGARDAGKEFGYDIYLRGPSYDATNARKQKDLIKIVEKKGCKGVVIAPQSLEINEDVLRLKNKGIPTVYIDRDMEGSAVISVIATNNFEAGRLAGMEMAKVVKGKKIALFRLMKNIVPTDNREAGFVKAIKEAGLEIVIDTYVGIKVGDAIEKVKKALKGRNDIDGVFAPNESAAEATLKALKQLKMTDKVAFIGFDTIPAFVKSVNAGQMHGFVVQRVYQFGYQGVKTIHRKLINQPIKKSVDTGAVFVSKKNINNKDVKKLLY